ncbi:MAG: Lpg1974 family pore-forming outer membrane protein [Parachlamydiales bacterium]
MMRGFNKHWALAALSLVALTGQSLCADDSSYYAFGYQGLGVSTPTKEQAVQEPQAVNLDAQAEQALAVTDAPIADAASPAQPSSSGQQVNGQQIGHRMFDPHGLKNSCNFWVEGEVLYWQSSMDDLDFAIKSHSTTSISHGHVEELDFDWDWGFRLGLGYKIPHDKWDLFLNYTHVHAHAHGSAHRENGAIFPQWMAPFAVTVPAGQTLYATRAHAHWSANVNIADIELGRNCFAGKWLSIRPFMGVRALFIDQDFHVNYKGGTAVPVGNEDKVSIDNDFWGVGLRMGFDSLWGLGAGWAIYGNGAASLLSGHFDIHQHEKLKNDIRKVSISDDVDNVVVAAELALGIQWDYLFSKDRYHFGVKFGWEFNVFFDQNQMIRFVSDTSPGAFSRSNEDLTFQGLTLGLRFDF